MNQRNFISLFLVLLCVVGCESTKTEPDIEPKNIAVPGNPEPLDYYIALEPKSNTIDHVLFLLPGFGQIAQQVLPDTKLPQLAAKNNMLCIIGSTFKNLMADTIVQESLTNIFKDVIEKYEVSPDQFVLGGFSAGGAILTRYTELCYEFPSDFPIQPKGVFAVDAPLDIFTIYDNFEESIENAYTKTAVDEARWGINLFREAHGIPSENKETYAKLTPFSMDKTICENEQYLMETAFRTYHDVDINWRLKERNQPVRNQNYLVSSELINRLLLRGHPTAEFIQTYQTGYRADGRRHPHSWSIVDEEECMTWIKSL